jgi:hypothetical protein
MAELSLKLEPFGPAPQAVRELVRALPRRPEVQAQLKGTRNRMLSFRLVDPETKERASTGLGIP